MCGPPIESPLFFVRGATRVKNISFLLSKGPLIGSPLLFVCGVTHVKNISFFLSKGPRSRAPYFLYAVLHV
jgi:hypothetical protein